MTARSHTLSVPTIAGPLRHVIALSAVSGCVEVIGYIDCGGIYPGIMTGNTVQLGLTSATGQWTQFDLIAVAVASFFAGGIMANLIRRQLRHPSIELLITALVLVVASFVRQEAGWRVAVELPLLAVAMAMQGAAIAKFGGISIQTIVVTNNLVRFTDALVGRYLTRCADIASRPALAEVLLPGVAWLSYSIAAGGAALAATRIAFPLLIAAGLLVLASWDMLRLDAWRQLAT